jgi:glycosyltransferase involved in cell wall biosynthesis
MRNQLKILHAAFMLKRRIGIIQQMQWELDASKELEIPWQTKLYVPKNLIHTNFSCIEQSPSIAVEDSFSFSKEILVLFKLQKEFYFWLKNKIEQYDILLLRYSMNDPFLYYFIDRVSIPTVLIHHTLETFELAMKPGPISTLRSWAEKMMGQRSLQAASGIIGVTQEILDYEIMRRKGSNIPTTVYPNGIYYEKSPADDYRTENPELLMVASYFAAWHGLDLLLDSIASCSKSFILHLVGELSNEHKDKIKNESRICVHNSLNHTQIKKLSASCWVGLSSFALYRNNMKQACTLKVREYLMMGLPVYADYEENFPDNFLFFRKGEASIDNILFFANEMRSVQRKTIAESAEPYISKTALLTELYQWLIKNHNNIEEKHRIYRENKLLHI